MFTSLVTNSGTDINKASSSFEIKTDEVGTSANNQFDLPLIPGGVYNCIVVDDTANKIVKVVNSDADSLITFDSIGSKEIRILGSATGFSFANGGDKDKLIRVKSTDTIVFGVGASPFWGCSNLIELNVAASSMVGMTNIVRFASQCPILPTIGGISSWPWSNFGSIAGAFRDSLIYDGAGVENVDISNVSIGESCFWNTSADVNLSAWDPFEMEQAQDFNNALSTPNLDALYNSWGVKANNGDLNFNDGVINFGTTKYSASAATNRNFLENYYTDLTDGGPV